MKTKRLKLILALFLSLSFILGCQERFDDTKLESCDETSDETSKYLECAVYHETTNSWMVPQNDPYTLGNFQRAYDRLSSGRSAQILTRAQTVAFSDTENLKATHFALKMYPKNESEQWKIELMPDIKVAYVPFDYVQLSEAEAELITHTRSAVDIYPEESRYSVTYDDLETSDGPIASESYTMPVLYVVWPCDKSLPDDLDYEIDYAVFIPSLDPSETRNSISVLNMDALEVLEREAIDLALGSSAIKMPATRAEIFRPLSGKICTFDHLMDGYAPIANLKMRFQLGSKIWETYTQSDGYFSIANTIPMEASFGYIFQHPRWKITYENSTSPITTTWGTIEKVRKTIPDLFLRPGSSHPEYEIHRAVNYYYNGIHWIQTWYYDEGIRIRALSNTNAKASAYFTYSKRDRSYITVYYNNRDQENFIIGSVLHELGHFTQYGERGGYTGYTAVHKLLRESFASYVGWAIGDDHYYSLGYKKPSPSFDVTYQGRQDWWKTDGKTAYYSPLFVDLVDDYNQYLASDVANPDPIKNFPHSVIRTLAAECGSWKSVKSKLQQYVGIYYTSAELNSFMAPYEYWFSKN